MKDTQEQELIDWSKAPEWANYVAKDEDGRVYWYANKPVALVGRWSVALTALCFQAGKSVTIPGPWRCSLRQRPAQKAGTTTAAAAEYHDTVNHPDHYQGKVECIDAIEAATEGLVGIEAVCTGNAIKYLWRWKKKGGRQDLEKARWYINKLLGDE